MVEAYSAGQVYLRVQYPLTSRGWKALRSSEAPYAYETMLIDRLTTTILVPYSDLPYRSARAHLVSSIVLAPSTETTSRVTSELSKSGRIPWNSVC